MKLSSLSFHDSENGWGFDGLTFFPDVTLLVGASGVGKTRILTAIRSLWEVATASPHRSLWGRSWATEFLDDGGTKCFWGGLCERRPGEDRDLDEFDADEDVGDGLADVKKPRFVNERLIVGGKMVFEREGEHFTLQGGERLQAKLSPFESGLTLLSEEDAIKPARAALARMLYVDSADDMHADDRRIYYDNVGRLYRQYQDLDQIRNSRLTTHMKLALVYEHDREVFDRIIGSYREVFPFIEQVQITRAQYGPFPDVPTVEMKEQGVVGFFGEHKLSAGMRRTLMHLARLTLWPDGTVILVDELENSLGANCINVVANEMLGAAGRLQFIVTSHHPYIINSIPMHRWKVIGRRQGQISHFTTGDLDIGRSRHEPFFQLINNNVFKYGMLDNEPVLSG